MDQPTDMLTSVIRAAAADAVRDVLRSELEAFAATHGRDELLTEAEAAQLLRVGRSTLARMRGDGVGPACVRMGATVRYLRSDLLEYAARCRVGRSAA